MSRMIDSVSDAGGRVLKLHRKRWEETTDLSLSRFDIQIQRHDP